MQNEISVILIETVENNNTEWGISFTNSNPNQEDYFKMVDKETAIRLKDRLAKHSPIPFN